MNGLVSKTSVAAMSPGVRILSSPLRRMYKKIIDQVRFFFVDFHNGVVNRILHLIGFGLFFVGLFEKNILLIIVGALVQESGHFYNYYVLKERDTRLNPFKASLRQLVILTPVVLLLFWIFKIL